MGIKKFIKRVVTFLSIDDLKSSNKKKSVKNLLKKLKHLRVKLYKDLQDETDKTKIQELQEEINIVTLQIKKGKEILNDKD